MLSKEELVRILASLITKNGDIAATTSMLQEQTIDKLQWMFDQQPEAARRAFAQVHELVANDLQLKAEREAVLQEKQKTLKQFQELPWSLFFGKHPDVVDNMANRTPLETYAISISSDGRITAANLEEAAKHPDIAKQLLRTAPKKPARKANLERDQETLESYCRSNRLSYPGAACLEMLRQTY